MMVVAGGRHHRRFPVVLLMMEGKLRARRRESARLPLQSLQLMMEGWHQQFNISSFILRAYRSRDQLIQKIRFTAVGPVWPAYGGGTVDGVAGHCELSIG